MIISCDKNKGGFRPVIRGIGAKNMKKGEEEFTWNEFLFNKIFFSSGRGRPLPPPPSQETASVYDVINELYNDKSNV